MAERLGKRHDNVLRAYDNLECSDDFRLLNFEETEEVLQNSPAKQKRRIVHMTRDGFIFLVMGFNVKRAAAIKEAYINAFSRMEKELQRLQNEPSVQVVQSGVDLEKLAMLMKVAITSSSVQT